MRQGDSRAFEQIVERYRDPLYRYCHGITAHAQDAEEALQITLLRAFQGLRGSERTVVLRPWLFAIARNVCLDLIRARREWTALPATVAAPGDDLGELHEARERFAGLRRDLADLDEPHRSALLLRELNGLSHREIGDTLGTSPESAKRLIFEARECLVERAAGRDLACADVRARISEHDGRMLRARRVRAHLDECASCSAYRASMRRRPRQLAAMFPVVPVGAAVRLLEGLAGAGAVGGGTGGLAALLGVSGGGAAVLGGLSTQTAALLVVATVGGGALVPGMVASDNGPRSPLTGVSFTSREATTRLLPPLQILTTGSVVEPAAPDDAAEPPFGEPSAPLPDEDRKSDPAGSGQPGTDPPVGAETPASDEAAGTPVTDTPGSAPDAPVTTPSDPAAPVAPPHHVPPGRAAKDKKDPTTPAPPAPPITRTAPKPRTAPGASGNAPGHPGTPAAAPTRTVGAPATPPAPATAPGRSGSAPGRSGGAPGHSGGAPGRAGGAPPTPPAAEAPPPPATPATPRGGAATQDPGTETPDAPTPPALPSDGVAGTPAPPPSSGPADVPEATPPPSVDAPAPATPPTKTPKQGSSKKRDAAKATAG